MDTALTQKFPFILDTNLAKANCTENRVCRSCDTVVLGGIISAEQGAKCYIFVCISESYSELSKFIHKLGFVFISIYVYKYIIHYILSNGYVSSFCWTIIVYSIIQLKDGDYSY